MLNFKNNSYIFPCSNNNIWIFLTRPPRYIRGNHNCYLIKIVIVIQD